MFRVSIVLAALTALAGTPALAADVRPRPSVIPAAAVTPGPTVITERLRPGPTVTTTEEVITKETLYYYAPVRYVAAPYFVVDQGPEFSGPGITITAITWTDTDLQRAYPFLGRSKPFHWRHGRSWKRGISALGAVPGVRTVWTRSASQRSTSRQPEAATRKPAR
jgi:hypothetical protein